MLQREEVARIPVNSHSVIFSATLPQSTFLGKSTSSVNWTTTSQIGSGKVIGQGHSRLGGSHVVLPIPLSIS